MGNLFSLIVTCTFSDDKLRDFFHEKLCSKGGEQLNESTYSLPYRAEHVRETCAALSKNLNIIAKNIENKIKKEESDFVDLYCSAHLCDIPNSKDKILRWKIL